MKRCLLILVLLLFIVITKAKSQLYINEISQGASGSKEYIEFVVAGTRTCSDSTMDLRGIIFDDNAGWYGTGAFNAGCMRFANNSNWSAVPYGSVILIYNSADKNGSIALSDDATDANHDYVYVVPSSSAYLEVNVALPSAISSSYDYSSAVSGTWSSPGTASYGNVMALGNSTDVVSVINPATSTTTAVHAVGWGTLANGSGSQAADIQFPSITSGGVNLYNSGSSPMSQSSWTSGSATTTSNTETPGTGNTTANTSWIGGMRLQVTGPLPATPGAISGPASVCANASGTYSVSTVSGTTSYTWTLPGGWSGSSTTNSISVTSGSTGGTISVVANNSCGSSAASTTSVTVNPTVTPSVSIAASPPSAICAATSVTFTPTPTGGGSTPAYGWYKNSTLVATGSSYAATGWSNGDQVYAVLTSSANCISSAFATSNTITLSVTPLPAASGNINGNTVVCSGSSNAYGVSAVSGATSYTWSLPSGWSGTSTTTIISALAGTASGSVSVTANNSCGSSTASTLSVTIQPVLVPSVSITASATTICAGASVTFSATPVNGGAAPTYQWKKNGINVGTGGNTYTDNSLVNGDVVTVVLTSNASCASPASANSNSIGITVNPVVTPSVTIVFSPAGTVCANSTVSFAATATNGGGAPIYQWYRNGSPVATGSSYSASSWTNGDQVYAILTSNATCATPSTATSNTVTLSILALPTAPTAISGLDTVCAGSTQTYSTASTSNATSYNWTLPGGWSGSSVATSITAVAGTTGGIVSVTASNSCGTSSAATLAVVVRALPSAPSPISGNDTICAGTTQTYVAAAAAGASSYSWVVPSGWSITSGINTNSIMVATNGTSGTISVSAVNVCGSSLAPATLFITVKPLVTPRLGITANPGTTICSGTSVVFTALDTNGGTAPVYQWLKNGLNVGVNQNTYTDNTLVNGDQISVQLNSNASCVTTSTATSPILTLNVTSVPAIPAGISGNTSVCPSSVNTYSISAVSGATSYVWTLPGGWSGTSITTSITATAGSTGGNVQVAAQNACGISAAVSLPVVVNATSTPSVTITSNASTSTICSGTSVTFSAAPINGGTPTYQWRLNSINISGATNATYTTSALTNGDIISVDMVSSLGCSIPGTALSNGIGFTVITVPAMSGTISGSVTVCIGTTQAYNVASVPGATSYSWTLPSGWSGSSNSNSITTIVGTVGGSIMVSAVNSCGTGASKTLAVAVDSIPGQPGVISGATAPCTGSSQAYSVTPVIGATSYNWALPTGWSGTSTNANISAIVGGNSGTVSVTAANACGTSLPASLAVTPVLAPPAASAISGNTSVCAGTSQTYSVTSVSGFNYIWAAPAGWTGSSNGNSITYTASSNSGTISVSLTGACGTSTATAIAVSSSPNVTPAVSITTAKSTICSGVATTFNAVPNNGGTSPQLQWLLNGTPVGATGSSFITNSLVTGDSVNVILTSNARCVTTNGIASNGIKVIVQPSVVPGINVNAFPGYAVCQGTAINFVSNITGGGNAPAYQWYRNGVLIPGVNTANYSTSSLNNSDTINAVLISNAVCPTVAAMPGNRVGVLIRPVVVPAISISSVPAMPIADGTPVTFTAMYSGGGATPDLQWLKNGLPIPFETANTYSASDLKQGDVISVRMISYEPCPSLGTVTANGITAKFPSTGISNTAGNWNGIIKLFPNPTNGHFSIDVDWGNDHMGERVQLDIFNVIGQSIYATELQPNRSQWSLNIWLSDALANGMYQLRLRSNSMQAVRPILIQH